MLDADADGLIDPRCRLVASPAFVGWHWRSDRGWWACCSHDDRRTCERLLRERYGRRLRITCLLPIGERPTGKPADVEPEDLDDDPHRFSR
jgi:hypothetical protein